MWDMSILQVVPGLRIAAPRDARPLREQLREAVDVDGRADRACASRRARSAPTCPAVDRRRRRRRAARRSGERDVLLVVASARWPASALEVGRAAARAGHRRHRRRPALGHAGDRGARRRWPRGTGWSSIVEDNGRVGGVGAAVAQALRDAGVDVPLRDFGIPQRFLDHGKRAEVLAEIGLTAQEISLAVVEAVAKLDAALL